MVPVYCISRSQELKKCCFFLTENLKNLLVRNHWTDFNITCRSVSLVTCNKDCSSRHDSSKNMAARRRGLFSLFIYMEKFKNLVRNHWTDFNKHGRNVPFVNFYQDCSSRHDLSKKPWQPGGRDLFSLYIYLENFRNHLVRNHWTDFNIL